eukprot:jgi/Bigna1/129175/aug1.8_g3883
MMQPEGGDVGLQCGKVLENDELTLEVCGVTSSNNNLLFWNGVTINGVAFKPDPDIGKFIFKCIYYRSDDEPRTLKLAVPTTCTMRQLAEKLHEKCPSLPGEHSKLMYHLMYQGSVSEILHLSKSESALVCETGLRSKGVILGVEANTGQDPDNSVTQAYHNEESNKVELLIYHPAAAKPFELSVMRVGTIALLKTLIKRAAPQQKKQEEEEKEEKEGGGGKKASSFSLRQMLTSTKPGCLYKDEGAKLESVGLTEPMMGVRVEFNTPPLQQDEIELIYTVYHKNSRVHDREVIRARLHDTVNTLKRRILQKAHLVKDGDDDDDDDDRKEKGGGGGGPSLFDRMAVFTTKGDPSIGSVHGKDTQIPNQDTVTLESLGMANRSAIWVAESSRNIDGSSKLQVYLYTNFQRSSVMAFQADRAKLHAILKGGRDDGGKETAAAGGGGENYHGVSRELLYVEEHEVALPYGGDMSKAMRVADRAAIRTIMAHNKKNKNKPKKKTSEVKALFEIPFINTLPLHDLKCALFSHPSGKLTSSCKSAKQLRIYTLKPNMALGPMLKDDNVSVLTQGVVGDMSIGVEIIPEEEREEQTFSYVGISLNVTQCVKAVSLERQLMAEQDASGSKAAAAEAKGATTKTTGEKKKQQQDAVAGSSNNDATEEQARKRVKTDGSTTTNDDDDKNNDNDDTKAKDIPVVVFGPLPPAHAICDIGPKMRPALVQQQYYDPYKSLLTQDQKSIDLSKLDLVKLPRMMEKRLLDMWKEKAKTMATAAAAADAAAGKVLLEPKDYNGLGPSLYDLRKMCSQISGIKNDDNLLVLKWFFNGFRWHILTPDLSERVGAAAAAVSDTAMKVEDNNTIKSEDVPSSLHPEAKSIFVKAAPILLKDGDHIAIVDKKAVFGSNMSFDEIEAIVSKIGPRLFITSRKASEPTSVVQKFSPQEQQLKIDV